MTNLERYFEYINKRCAKNNEHLDCVVADLRKKSIGADVICSKLCDGCRKCSVQWLLAEYKPYKELENGDNLNRGKLIEVSTDGKDWYKRQFLAHIDGRFWCFNLNESGEASAWRHARLTKKEDDIE